MSLIKNLTKISILALFAVGCASEPKVRQLAASADPQVELERIEKNIGAALKNQADVLAPTHYEEAQDAKNKAIRQRRDNADQNDILRSLSLAQGHLDMANQVVKINQTVLPRQIAARGYAMNASLGLEYEELKYGSASLEQLGPFTLGSSFESVKMTQKSWIASVSFPIEL
jgi:hypothetical protein